jgi:hypothetical protein
MQIPENVSAVCSGQLKNQRGETICDVVPVMPSLLCVHCGMPVGSTPPGGETPKFFYALGPPFCALIHTHCVWNHNFSGWPHPFPAFAYK